MASERQIDAAAEALWYDASKERFGPWAEVEEKVKALWRRSAKAALDAAAAIEPNKEMANQQWVDWAEVRPGATCPKCKKARTVHSDDPCIACLPGVLYACCGHGETGGYLYFENGIRIGMQVLMVEQFYTVDGSRHARRTDTAAD